MPGPSTISKIPIPKEEENVWGSAGPTIDSCRIDRIQDALRAKVETLNGGQITEQPDLMLRKIFGNLPTGKIREDQFVEVLTTKLNFNGYAEDVRALFRRYDVDHSQYLDLAELGQLLFNSPGTLAKSTLGKVREILARRAGGASTLKSMGRQFRIMDRSGDGLVSMEEMKIGFDKFMRGFGVILSKREIEELMKYFDKTGDGFMSYDEFVRGLRGSMGPERLWLVQQAFNILDTDGSGSLSLQEIASKYDVSRHPKVLDGTMSPEDAIRVFMKQWDKSGDGIVTYEEFVEYYEWISASIDNDDYFELMMRNAWHISGGKGWAENTSNLRVLVKHADGSETVEEVKNDLGLKKDPQAIRKRLEEQGIKDIVAISTTY